MRHIFVLAQLVVYSTAPLPVCVSVSAAEATGNGKAWLRQPFWQVQSCMPNVIKEKLN